MSRIYLDILSKTANIKMLEQKILSLQQELQRQYNTPTPQQQPISNLVNPQTNIPMQVPGMMPHIADINQRAPGEFFLIIFSALVTIVFSVLNYLLLY